MIPNTGATTGGVAVSGAGGVGVPVDAGVFAVKQGATFPANTSSVVGWWDPGTPSSVTSGAGTASQVNNLLGSAGNLVQASGSSQPGYGSTTQNGLNTLHQTLSRFMTATLSAGLGDFYFAAVVNVLGTSAAYTTLASFGSFAPALYMSSSGAANHPDFFLSTDHPAADVTITTGAHFIEGWRTGTSAFFAIDGTAGAALTVANTATAASFAIFADIQTGADYGNIDLGEMLLATDLTNQTAFRARAKSRWGTP